MESRLHDPKSDLSVLVDRITHLENQLYRISIASNNPRVTASLPPVIANPSPLGLLGFAIVSWLSGLLKIYGQLDARIDGLFAGTAFFIGGIAQLVAGFIQFAKNETHSSTIFSLYGLHWLNQSFILTVTSVQQLSFPPLTVASSASYFALLAVATLLLWIPTFRMNRVLNVTLAIVFLAFTLDSVAARGWRAAEIAAGIAACSAATLGFYMALLDLVNEIWKRPLLPLFPHNSHKEDYDDRTGSPYVPRWTFHKSSMSSSNL